MLFRSSLCVDIKAPEGLDIVHSMLRDADVFVENFGPGALDRNGLGWEKVHAINSRLIYCALKGFLPGPYEKRPAMDEVVQMLGGLAYMTGLPDRPLRAGASVADITGGVMGALGVMAALRQRDSDGQGRQVMSSLFETVAFFMGQHLAEEAMSGRQPMPMAMRRKSWAVYELFPTADSREIFIAVLSQRHWVGLCKALGLDDEAGAERFSSNDRRLANVMEVRQIGRAHV